MIYLCSLKIMEQTSSNGLKKTFFSKKKGALFLISGPCSAESREQMMNTALAVSKSSIDLIRAGIWKPRTRPGSFEGVGSIGLPWLKEAGLAAGLPVAVEVAKPAHVEECLKTGIDVLWIGARTSVNPFLVQEIADALKGTDIPVMIKNPVNPDLELWIGAIERIAKAGSTNLAAIHRGFSTYEKIMYRNNPKWEIPVELKRRLPEIPVFCDPSHICGNTTWLASVSQTAIDLDFDGLMLESHINPLSALSDRNQQLNPEELGLLLQNLVYRRPSIDDKNILNNIESLRNKIDYIDNNLLEILAARMEVARSIGEYKKQANTTILQRMRWEEIVQSRIEMGSEKKLSENFIFQLFEIIHQEAIHQQSGIMNNKEDLAKKRPQ
jgi:chorismate mutase